MKKFKQFVLAFFLISLTFLLSCSKNQVLETKVEESTTAIEVDESLPYEVIPVNVTDDMEFAEFSKVKTGTAYLYKQKVRKVIMGKFAPVVAINAGHGTKLDGDVKTLSHPDGSPKVTGGTTKEGEKYSLAISTGMSFADGVTEAETNLLVALYLRDELLNMGYDVLMIRESLDTQLDNIARTILANKYADIHIAIHYDSTNNDKGIFYCSTPNSSKYRKMYPVKDTYEKNDLLGDIIIGGLLSQGEKLYGNGKLPIDLTQMSYTKIPSIDLELGDKASVHTPERLAELASKIALAIYCIPLEQFF